MMLARMHPARRGSVVFIVLWTIALAALATAATQLHAFRQAGFGREALERTQARWAARGGIEASIQAMINNTEQPFEDDMKAVMLDLEIVHAGALPGARYSIEHSREGTAHACISFILPTEQASRSTVGSPPCHSMRFPP